MSNPFVLDQVDDFGSFEALPSRSRGLCSSGIESDFSCRSGGLAVPSNVLLDDNLPLSVSSSTLYSLSGYVCPPPSFGLVLLR